MGLPRSIFYRERNGLSKIKIPVIKVSSFLKADRLDPAARERATAKQTNPIPNPPPQAACNSNSNEQQHVHAATHAYLLGLYP